MSRVLIALLLVIPQVSYTQSGIKSLISELKKPAFYPTVSESKSRLINAGKQSIPLLINALQDTGYVKLTNAEDLIYPGAKQIQGYGTIINYDIDWICVRAGWVLEEFTFEDFGYHQNQLTEENMLAVVNRGMQDESATFRSIQDPSLIEEYRKHLAKKVQQWWEDNYRTWTRFEALKKALKSDDYNCRIKALNYLRNGETYCRGLFIRSFDKELKPIIKTIAKEGSGFEREQARFLLDSKDYSWIAMKRR